MDIYVSGADIVIFDPAAVRDAADYAKPTRPAEGIDAVMVNGVVTWQHGRHTGAQSGQVLTRPGSAEQR